MKYPIEDVLDTIKSALVSNRSAVVQAPPGAGKTTIVPVALIDEDWLSDKKIIMLEPRRIAARAAAYRMAELLNEPVGRTVGYHISMEKRSGPETRIEIITEGILTRKIQTDPSLKGVGLIIFDEFHERNLHSDLGLALAIECCEAFSDDLRLLVMSATLDTEGVSSLLGGAEVITSDGKSWPVETRYLPLKIETSRFGFSEKKCADVIMQATAKEEGDVLVFLPGAAEISRVQAVLTSYKTDDSLRIIPLFGNLSKEDQDRAVLPSPQGKRKIVLATSIAETSITIDGVSIVIDSGLMRTPRYYSGTGMSRLETIPVSKASADQRRGRAGRTKAGICYRLWRESSHKMLKEFNSPEMLNTDLTGFMLELALWGISRPDELKLMTPPPESAVIRAQQILIELGAVEADGKITRHGKQMAVLGLHPRLAHMILKGIETGDGYLACQIAAVLSERDFIFFTDSSRQADIVLRLEILNSTTKRKGEYDKNIKLNRAVISKIQKTSLKYRNVAGIKNTQVNFNKAGMLLAFAFPERILQLRSSAGGNYLMAGGSGACFADGDFLAYEKYIAAASMDGNPVNSKVYLGAKFSETELCELYQDKLETTLSVKWDQRSKSVVAKKELKYRALVISAETVKNADPELVSDEMISGIKKAGIECLPWNKELRNFQARAVLLFSTGRYDTLPDISDATLSQTLDVWLKPFLSGISKLSRLAQIDLKSVLSSMFSWEDLQKIETNAPTHVSVPSGSKIPLRYITKENGIEPSPVLAVRLQELFGMKETPCVAGGRIPVTIHLLSPASRPVQVTTDLKSFWETTYQDVKKELKGRYPRHYWPDDPMTATATNKTKKAR